MNDKERGDIRRFEKQKRKINILDINLRDISFELKDANLFGHFVKRGRIE